MRRWGSSCRRIHLMRCRCRPHVRIRNRRVLKPATLVREGEEILCCDVGGGLEMETETATATEMSTFQFSPQEVVRGASFRAHVQVEVFSLFHRDQRHDLKKNSIPFFHVQVLVLFSPFREVWYRICVANLPQRHNTHLRVCLHVPAAE